MFEGTMSTPFSPLEASTAWLRSVDSIVVYRPNRKERYERLPDDSQAVIEEQQEEIESMEAEAEEEKK